MGAVIDFLLSEAYNRKLLSGLFGFSVLSSSSLSFKLSDLNFEASAFRSVSISVLKANFSFSDMFCCQISEMW